MLGIIARMRCIGSNCMAMAGLDRDDDGMPLKIEKLGGWEYLYYLLYTIGNKIDSTN